MSERTVEDWRRAVAEGKTLLGFQDWLAMWRTPLGQRVGLQTIP